MTALAAAKGSASPPRVRPGLWTEDSEAFGPTEERRSGFGLPLAVLLVVPLAAWEAPAPAAGAADAAFVAADMVWRGSVMVWVVWIWEGGFPSWLVGRRGMGGRECERDC